MHEDNVSTVCMNAYTRFNSLWQNTDEKLYKLCAEGLHNIATQAHLYQGTSTASAPFFKELIEQAKKIAALDPLHNADTQAIAFQLFEALAIVTLETVLKNKAASPVDRNICDYFETSGHWAKEQKTLATDCYYYLVPQTYSPS